jgi:microcompartment protein CcmK/EutM
VQDASFEGKKLLIVQPIDLEGRSSGDEMIAIDMVSAGPDELVLISKEGGGARLALDDPSCPAQCLIVGVIDDIKLWNDNSE